MQTDFTVQPWTFKDTTARVVCNTAEAARRMDGAQSVDVQLGSLINFVGMLTRQGFSVQLQDNTGKPSNMAVLDADYGKEHRVKLASGVTTAYPRNNRKDAERYMLDLIKQGISFTYSFER
jgi:hypothetical protein